MVAVRTFCEERVLLRYTCFVHETVPLQFVVAEADAGARLDRAVASHCAEISRTRIQELIAEGLILLNGRIAKGSAKVRAGDQIQVTPQPRPPLAAEPEQIPLQVLYEDADMLAINKPAGMIVHAGAGNARGTLVNALLGRGQTLSNVGDALRPGIVHRLDKDTSGIILVAKNDFAHARLAESFRKRTIEKTYIALVQGNLPEEKGRIELSIARDPKRRNRMTAKRASAFENARQARTDWSVVTRLGPTTLISVRLHTGRTHQIRVHLSALRHPVVGDTLYGAPAQLQIDHTKLPPLGRQFLHAAYLRFEHPRTGEMVSIKAPIGHDLLAFLHRIAREIGTDTVRIDALLAPFL